MASALERDLDQAGGDQLLQVPSGADPGRTRGGHVAVGWLSWARQPAMREDQRGHRTLFCRNCGFEVFLPPHLQIHDRPQEHVVPEAPTFSPGLGHWTDQGFNG